MIKQLIRYFKALQEQQKQQLKLNALINNTKSESIKIRIPKKYVSLIEVLVKYGIDNPEQLIRLIKCEVLHFRHQHYDILEISVVEDQNSLRFTEKQLRDKAMYQLMTTILTNDDASNIIKSERQQQISPWHYRYRYSIKVAVEKK